MLANPSFRENFGKTTSLKNDESVSWTFWFNRYMNFVPVVTYALSRDIITVSSCPIVFAVKKQYFENTFITLG